MAINWDKEVYKASKAMARNRAAINNAPTSHGTAASWSNPAYDLPKQINDMEKLKEKDYKKQRRARRKGPKHPNAQYYKNQAKRKRGQAKRPRRKATGPFLTDPRTNEIHPGESK